MGTEGEINIMVKRILIAPTAAQRRQGAQLPDRLRLVAADKGDLDRMISTEQRQGWLLVCRTHSMDDGHGAELVRTELHKAA